MIKYLFLFMFLLISSAQANFLESKLIGKQYKSCKIIDVIFVPTQYQYGSDHYIIICMDERNGILKQYKVFDFKYEDDISTKDLYKLINQREK